MLHITNGDFAADLIKSACGTKDVIAWQDILYEGPVQNLPLQELSQLRAKYLSSTGDGNFESIEQSFLERDEKLLSYSKHDEIVLWFEHDTYDQLQLMQILNWFSSQPIKGLKISLICINEFPGVKPFLGLGQLDSHQMASLFPKRELVSTTQLSLASTIWNAFTSSDPNKIVEIITEDLSGFPYMKNALIRYLREFPSADNGLTWTEQYILESIKSGTKDFSALFSGLPEAEGKYFLGLGDTTFKKTINNMLTGSQPVIKSDSQKKSELKNLELTAFGNDILNHKKDAIKVNGINRWIGGAHLRQSCYWKWNESNKKLNQSCNIDKVNIKQKFELINEHWSPKIAGEINDAYIKLAKFKGEFVWHKHDDEDEMFFVVKGNLIIKLRDKKITLHEGEFIVIPRGVEHLPIAEGEVQVMLLEPKSTLNTGDDFESNLAVHNLDHI